MKKTAFLPLFVLATLISVRAESGWVAERIALDPGALVSTCTSSKLCVGISPKSGTRREFFLLPDGRITNAGERFYVPNPIRQVANDGSFVSVSAEIACPYRRGKLMIEQGSIDQPESAAKQVFTVTNDVVTTEIAKGIGNDVLVLAGTRRARIGDQGQCSPTGPVRFSFMRWTDGRLERFGSVKVRDSSYFETDIEGIDEFGNFLAVIIPDAELVGGRWRERKWSYCLGNIRKGTVNCSQRSPIDGAAGSGHQRFISKGKIVAVPGYARDRVVIDGRLTGGGVTEIRDSRLENFEVDGVNSSQVSAGRVTSGKIVTADSEEYLSSLVVASPVDGVKVLSCPRLGVPEIDRYGHQLWPADDGSFLLWANADLQSGSGTLYKLTPAQAGANADCELR